MQEGSRLDQYFARKDTVLAKSLRRISPKVGSEYRHSRIKRMTDIGFALACMALQGPRAQIAKWKVRREDGMSPIYIQDRILGPSEKGGEEYVTFRARKIRTMHMGSDTKEVFGVNKYRGDNDPRLLDIAKKIKPQRLDEYPQLKQIVKGEMSFVGLRATHPYEWESMKEVLGENFSQWRQAYFDGKPSYATLFRTKNAPLDFPHRYYWDMEYAKRANLGMDLFIFYMLLKKILKKK